MRLFVERARAVEPDFAPDRRERRGRGRDLPPAGRPAAGDRAGRGAGRLLAAAALLARLESRLPLLTGGARDLPARQQTLRATHRLEPRPARRRSEQACSGGWRVFAGGCDLEAAEAVCARRTTPGSTSSTGSPRWSTRACCGRPEAAPATRPRFRMLETVREYALERLAASGELDAVERALEGFLWSRLETADVELQGPEQAEWLDWLEAEHDNYRAVLGRALEQADGEFALRLAAGLWRFWLMRGYAGEGQTWLARALDAGDLAGLEVRSKALQGLGHLAIELGDYAGAGARFAAGLEHARQAGDQRGIAESLSGLGLVALNRQEYGEARAWHEQALAIRRQLGDRHGTAWSLYYLGIVTRSKASLRSPVNCSGNRSPCGESWETPRESATRSSDSGWSAASKATPIPRGR